MLAEEMRRTLRFWEWDAKRWEDRAAKYAPAQVAGSIYIPPEDEKYDSLVKRAYSFAEILFDGKAAYALRQTSGRRALLLDAKGKFDPLIKLTDPDGKSEFVEIVDTQ